MKRSLYRSIVAGIGAIGLGTVLWFSNSNDPVRKRSQYTLFTEYGQDALNVISVQPTGIEVGEYREGDGLRFRFFYDDLLSDEPIEVKVEVDTFSNSLEYLVKSLRVKLPLDGNSKIGHTDEENIKDHVFSIDIQRKSRYISGSCVEEYVYQKDGEGFLRLMSASNSLVDFDIDPEKQDTDSISEINPEISQFIKESVEHELSKIGIEQKNPDEQVISVDKFSGKEKGSFVGNPELKRIYKGLWDHFDGVVKAEMEIYRIHKAEDGK